jgi:hypothetical protein
VTTAPVEIGLTAMVASPGQVRVQGGGWPGNTSVRLTIDGVDLGDVVTAADGSFSIDLPIPTDVRQGTVTITGLASNQARATAAMVLAATPLADVLPSPAAPSVEALAFTGYRVRHLALIALLLLAAGVSLVETGRRLHRD